MTKYLVLGDSNIWGRLTNDNLSLLQGVK